MTTFLVVAFLAVHGLVHLAVWLPKPEPDKPTPFAPDHSAVMTAVHVPTGTTHRTAVGLAVATAVAFLLAAAAVALDVLVVPTLVAAAVLGLVLKALYFNPWLSLGVLLDVLVLTTALWGWPISL